MVNVTFIVNELDGSEHAIIEHADGGYTSMTKAVYDEMIAAQNEAALK